MHRLVSTSGDVVAVVTAVESGIKVLEFDETVVIFPRDPAYRSHDNLTGSSTIDGLLRSASGENETTMESVDESNCTLWILGETDRERNKTSQRQCLAIEIDRVQSTFRHRGVALPLCSPTITVCPIQSMVISMEDTTESFFNVRSGSNGSSSSSDDRMSILKQAFWKRQLVGKVIAFEDKWTSRIKLTSETNSNGGGASDTTKGAHSESGSDVYAVIESCTPLRLATMTQTYSPLRVKDNEETLSLPNNFYMVLPSTYITIQPSTIQGPTKSSAGIHSELISSPSESTKMIPQNTPRPPSPAASLLMDTLDCIRSRGAEDGNIPRSFLLSGPPGVGKTFSVSWAAKAHPDTILCSIRGSELLQGNRSSNNLQTISPARALELEFLKLVEEISLREKWKYENEDASLVAGLVFLDECDALVSVEPIAAMLADLLDRISSLTASSSLFSEDGETNDVVRYWKRIVVVGATNRIGSIPSYLRRAGRFDRELPISPPTAEKRAELLRSLLKNLQSNKKEEEKTNELTLPLPDEIQEIAKLCVGYVAADLSGLVRKAWLLFLQEKDGNGTAGITLSHLEKARIIVGASALRDAALAAPPEITWDDIAGDPGGAKTALRQAIEWPRLKEREFSMLGLQPCRGVLLHGPPGCAKTTLARAAAGSSGVAFLSLSPAQVYGSSYVGEAERVVRQAFHLARSTTPCILFFDEIDSIFGDGSNDCGNLGGSGRGSSTEARVLSTFLNEMDGVDIASTGKDGVLVLGATNRPWTLDPALLRPGRLGDKIIFLPPPDKEARCSIFARQFGNVPSIKDTESKDEMSWDLDFNILVELSDGMTGAEIVGACQEAKIQWMREVILNIESVRVADTNETGFHQQDCIMDALMSIKPLLSNPQALKEFQVFENRDKKQINR